MRTQALAFSIFLVASMVPIPPLAAAAEPMYFAQVGAGELAGTTFRTQFRLINEQSTPLSGALTFFTSKGEPMTPEVSVRWNPQEGTVTQEENRLDFQIPVAGSLQLTLTPGTVPQVGYARLDSEGDRNVQAFFQFSRPKPGATVFEEGLIREVEIRPLEPLNAGSFLLSYVNGVQRLNTAIAIVNLSAVPAQAKLVQRPDNEFPITLAPGEVFTGFFDQLIPGPVVQVFPLENEAVAEIASPTPLGIAVIRTLQGFPLSGVQVAEVAPREDLLSGQLGEEVELPLGRTVRFEEAGLQLTFWNVTEESRCPIGVSCVWEGRVRTIVRGTQNGADLGELDLTLPGLQNGSSTGSLGDFNIELRRVDPYPDATLGQLATPEYSMALVVTRADP